MRHRNAVLHITLVTMHPMAYAAFVACILRVGIVIEKESELDPANSDHCSRIQPLLVDQTSRRPQPYRERGDFDNPVWPILMLLVWPTLDGQSLSESRCFLFSIVQRNRIRCRSP